MKFKKILLLYKRSAYKIYFLEHKNSLAIRADRFLSRELDRFKQAHDEHYATLKEISRVLLSYGIEYDETYRGRGINYSKYDLIITVGGDGTFLEASRNIRRDQYVFGVNSALNFSVGRFCVGNVHNFSALFKQIVQGKWNTALLHRLQMTLNGKKQPIHALNDILICHRNPAMLCRYLLKIGKKSEEQRSSGIWVSTPAGSSGAIRSAGGKLLPQYAQKMQYIPRELYAGKSKRYYLRGGVLKAGKKIEVLSLMRAGVIYVDGAHYNIPFSYGSTFETSVSSEPVKTFHFNR